MPGLINVRNLTAASSTKAGEGGDFCKHSFADKVTDERPPPFWFSSTAVRLSSARASQTAKVPSAVRLKQVTDPLDENVRARLYGDVTSTERINPNYRSSGSEHDPSSVCLDAMVNEFMENESSFSQCGRTRCNCHRGNAGAFECPDCDNDDSNSSIGSEICQAFEALVRCSSDSEAMLLTNVMQILGSIAGEMSDFCVEDAPNPTHSFLNRAVTTLLRRSGYNAAICKSKWDHSCGIPSGGHEYIDVLGEDMFRKCDRLIVDIDFRAQFEIARPTVEYTTVWQLLPPIFVGKPERLQRIISFMSEAAKQSLELRGLHLPPWRKPSYIKAKWFSPYRRILKGLTHSCREGDCVGTTEGAGITVNGQGLDARCSSESEMLYHAAGPTFWMRDFYFERENMAERNDHAKQSLSDGALWNSKKCSKKRDTITVIATEWQPPAVAPRSTQKPGKVTGLASVLMQAGLADSQHTVAKQEERLARAA